jgi:hypothetical protein
MLLIEFADGTRLKMVGFGDAEGFGRQPDGLEVTELCGLNATMTPKTRRLVRSRRLPALRKSSDASRIELAPSLGRLARRSVVLHAEPGALGQPTN